MMAAPAIIGGKSRLRRRGGTGGKYDGNHQGNTVQSNHSRNVGSRHRDFEMGLSRGNPVAPAPKQTPWLSNLFRIVTHGATASLAPTSATAGRGKA
jgi:hypothetical protein